MFDAVGDVVLEDFLLDPPQRGTHRRNLRDDIDAVALLLHHLGETAHLAFDPAEAFLTGCLDVFSHVSYIPPTVWVHL